MAPPPTSPTPRRRKRPRPLPHVMARNLAIEKRRREEMNGNFLDLAHLVPSLAHAQRLTKVRIVGETIAHLREQRALCAAAARDMLALLADNRRGDGSGGTATLRDAHEGPEPRKKTALAAVGDGGSQQDATLSSTGTGQGSGTGTWQYDLGLWETEFEFTAIPASQEERLPWSCSTLPLPPESSSLPAPTGVPTPPREGFDAIAHLTFPASLLPDDTLFNTTLDDSAATDDIWSGLGL
ncbi:Basic helix-loop-helix dimerization region bHLH [Cordyceps fumosorosea ARSEF 2679]|uniref:Basic helix-loop-helix dimerization region bHLH n=1 Tax=Cordyceps fumosorosea (strain ARSEF 2679) TaxID=1081104 RepID=A0A162MVK1_CORFA|nr:Basic helix-loop-helix dimerization region bHLH [Cordyceps fumosorosea ARSEF 2679]OAA71239.1 Basic helix-loop-helix dimerization region bHLH [Cordyceps fumosorosea ARSEF 2679]